MKGLTPGDEKIVRDIISRFAPDCEVYAFGSRVSGAYKETSDLDLAFALSNGATLSIGQLGDIKEAFSESDLIFRVDVIDYNGARQYFREIIDRERHKI